MRRAADTRWRIPEVWFKALIVGIAALCQSPWRLNTLAVGPAAAVELLLPAQPAPAGRVSPQRSGMRRKRGTARRSNPTHGPHDRATRANAPEERTPTGRPAANTPPPARTNEPGTTDATPPDDPAPEAPATPPERTTPQRTNQKREQTQHTSERKEPRPTKPPPDAVSPPRCQGVHQYSPSLAPACPGPGC